MVKNAHSEKTTQASSEYREEEKGSLGDAPFIPAGFLLVKSHGQKSRQIDDRQVNGDISQDNHVISVFLSRFLHLHGADLA